MCYWGGYLTRPCLRNEHLLLNDDYSDFRLNPLHGRGTALLCPYEHVVLQSIKNPYTYLDVKRKGRFKFFSQKCIS